MGTDTHRDRRTLVAELPGLVACDLMFLPGDPPRTGRIAFWAPPGAPLPDVGAAAGPLTVVRPHGDSVRRVDGSALFLGIADALPLLTRARAHPKASDSAVFWGRAALRALSLVASGRVLPGVSPQGFDAWRAGPIDPGGHEDIAARAAAMPPRARAVPLSDVEPPTLPDAERLLRSFLDAVADTVVRSPAAPLVAAGAAFAAPEPRQVPGLRPWAAEVAAGRDAGLRVSLRLELGLGEAAHAAVQLHSLADPTVVTDAADLWAGRAARPELFGPRARIDTLLTLRRAVRAWPPAARLLEAAAPTGLDLSDDETEELLGAAVERLASAGVAVHWPKELVRELTATGVLEPVPRKGTVSSAAPLLSADTVVAFRWRVAFGDGELTDEELETLVRARRPVVRLRDQWVVVDRELAGRLSRPTRRGGTPLSAVDALGAALTGDVEIDGRRVRVSAAGALEKLRALIADPEAGRTGGAPKALAATLRGYQLRGLDWLHRMTSLGLGACLADDMGLGKTVTLIALHLRRQETAATAGPTLVVCPATLLGNWEREIARFAPGVNVRRYHGADRAALLEDLGTFGTGGDAGFVLTTYGTMRRDAPALAAVPWGLVTADEAQHVKNPHSDTARALRGIPAPARVALTGTPVENNLSELWALLDWTTPGLLGTLPSFRRRYATAVEGDRDDDAARRLAALVRPFLLRRRKSDPGVAPELPPKTETDQPVSLTREQVSLYEALVRELMAEIAGQEGIGRRGLVVKLLTGLKQICNHPAQYLKEPAGTRLPGRSGKLELLDELLDTILAEDGSVLVFTQYVAMARILERHLADRGVGSLLLHGGTPVARREAMVDAFQRGETRVFLLSLKAAGTGLNLTRAGHVVHYDRWWNPAVEDQATDRAYRIGQTQAVQVHKLVAEGTVEERIAELLLRKRELAESVLGAGEAAFSELGDAELAELVSLRSAR